MDGHSKREVLQILKSMRKMLLLDLFLKPVQFVNYLRFIAKWSHDISCDLLTQYYFIL